jgi:transcriptional regulator with XRE-family HTH domain
LSYLSRMESGQMTPSLRTIEKIADALKVGTKRFYTAETNEQMMLADPFLMSLAPFLRNLTPRQRQDVLHRLQAITAPAAAD